MIKYSYGSSKGNKVWVRGHIKESEYEWINISIELNKDKSKSKIAWIIKEIKNKEINLTYEELNRKYNKDIIKEAYEFAKEKGYLKIWE